MIRSESSDDIADIRRINKIAFPTEFEADLVDRLRAANDAVLSLVAYRGGAAVGHVLFSRMAAPFPALGLAPVAVLPDHRRQGIAAALIREGLSRAKGDGWAGIFVLGDPAYYGRFGFSADQAAGFSNPHAGAHFMALALAGNDLPLREGRVDYAPAFLDGSDR